MSQNSILFLINSLGGGGAEKNIQVLSNNLIQKNKIFIFSFCGKIDYEINENVQHHSIFPKKTKLNKYVFILLLPIICLKLYRFCKKNNVEYVYSLLAQANLINAFTNLIFQPKYKSVISFHSPIEMKLEKKSNLGKFLYQKQVTFLTQNVTKIHVVSNGLKKEIEKYTKANKEIIVIYNPIEIEKINALANEPILDFIQIPKDHLKIICVNSFFDYKNQLLILKALAKTNNKKISLFLLGKGPEETNLKTFCKKNNLSDRVHFFGFQKNPFKYINQSDIFILSSTHEGLSNSLLEAMVLKKLILSTDCPFGPKEILFPNYEENISSIHEATYGILFKNKSIENLSLILDNEEQLKKWILKYKEVSFQRVEQMNVDIILAQYLSCLFSK